MNQLINRYSMLIEKMCTLNKRYLLINIHFIKKLLIFGLLILVTQSITAQGRLDSGLVAFWPFSRNADDSTGNGHNGTVFGAILTYDRFGRDSMAYDFNGITDYISIADDTAWAFGQRPFTVLFWANFRVVRNYYLMGQSEGPFNTTKWIFMYENNMLRFHLNSPATGPLYTVSFPWQPSINRWYQIAVTRETYVYRLYIDSTQAAFNVDTHAVRNSNAPLLIGNAEGTGQRFFGRLDDVRIYHRALSIQEIRTLFSAGLTGVAELSDFPITYNLEQNYPNPFNPITKIRFSLPLPSNGGVHEVKLVVYDVLGREVASLLPPLRGGQEGLKPGIYEAEWDAKDYPSGIYFYKLLAGEFIETKKMVLIK